MIVGLTLWPPPSFHYPKVFYPNVAPLCLSYSSNKGSKLQEQKNYWQSVKWSLNRTDAVREWGLKPAHDGLSSSRWGMYWVLFASLLAARSRMNFTQWPRFMKTRVSWPEPGSGHDYLHTSTQWCSEWEQLGNEARALRMARLLSNITPKTDGYD